VPNSIGAVLRNFAKKNVVFAKFARVFIADSRWEVADRKNKNFGIFSKREMCK
jgi:hypothetical protein